MPLKEKQREGTIPKANLLLVGDKGSGKLSFIESVYAALGGIGRINDTHLVLVSILNLHRLNDLPKLTFTKLRGFHGAFSTGVACQQGALTLPDTWFRPPLWDSLVLHLLRPDSSNLPCLYLTFHLEYPFVLSFSFIISVENLSYTCIHVQMFIETAHRIILVLSFLYVLFYDQVAERNIFYIIKFELALATLLYEVSD